MNKIDESNKPEIYLCCYTKKDFDHVKSSTGYPYLTETNVNSDLTLFDRAINKITTFLFGYHMITKPPIRNLDAIFPCTTDFIFDKMGAKIFWVPDFQEYYYPEFFSEEELSKRKTRHLEWIQSGGQFVFSSQCVKDDFHEFYPHAKVKTTVLNFAVTHHSIPFDEKTALKKYRLNSFSYFMCSNQFWQHKNHWVILKALLELKKAGISVKIIFTGSKIDNRNPDYYRTIEEYVIKHELSSYASFLGLIPREEQLELLKYSRAIIQPSLFEGWSTIVEDAKALNKHLLLSDIPVHREQIDQGVDFFDPQSQIALTELLIKYTKNRPMVVDHKYEQHIQRFGKKFLGVLKDE